MSAVAVASLLLAGAAHAATTYPVTATISVRATPYGAAVDPGLHVAAVAAVGDDSVSLIDTNTNAVTATVAVGQAPFEVAIDPVSHRAFVVNYSDDTVSVVDLVTATVVATIGVGSSPTDVTVDPGSGTVFVTNGDDDSVSVIDESPSAVTSTVTVGDFPSGVAVDTVTHTVYVANANGGSISVVDPLAGTVTDTIPVIARPTTLDSDPLTGSLWVSSFDDSSVAVIDQASRTVTATIPVAQAPEDVTLDPGTATVYVTDFYTDQISAIDEATRTVTPVAVGRGPGAIGVDRATHKVYVANTGDDSVSVITPTESSPVPTVDTTVSKDQAKASTSITSPRTTTGGAGRLLVAYVEADGPSAPTQEVTGVTGGGLRWQLAVRSNATWGTTEVWYAYAPGSFSAKVTARLRQKYDASITVAAYVDAATAPTAAKAAAGIGGTSTVTVNPTKAGSLVVASAHNWSVDAAPRPVAGQSLVHSYLDKRVHDTYWVQTSDSRTTGAPMTLSASIPAGSRWTMAAVEIPGR